MMRTTINVRPWQELFLPCTISTLVVDFYPSDLIQYSRFRLRVLNILSLRVFVRIQFVITSVPSQGAPIAALVFIMLRWTDEANMFMFTPLA